MRICHEPAVVRGDRLDQFHDLIACHEQSNVDNNRTNDIEQQMDQCSSLRILFTGHRS